MAGVKGMHWRASTSPTYAESVRARIRAGGIAKRLEGHVLGKIEMTSSQVSAALGLLRKVVPDLSATELSGPNGGPIELTHEAISDAARRIAFLLTQGVIEKAKRTEDATNS